MIVNKKTAVVVTTKINKEFDISAVVSPKQPIEGKVQIEVNDQTVYRSGEFVSFCQELRERYKGWFVVFLSRK